MKLEPRAIFLDLDGTIADSLHIMKRAYQIFMIELGRLPSDDEFDSLNGPPLRQIVNFLRVEHSIDETNDALLLRYSKILDIEYQNVPVTNGALSLLEVAKRNRCQIGIITSNNKNRTLLWLENVGLEKLVDFVISGDDVVYGKPNSEPYEAAKKKVGVSLDQMLAVEDSPSGAESSLGAGLRTFVLRHENHHSWPRHVEPITSLSQFLTYLW